MPPVLRDPATGLDCSETPFRPPKTLSRTDLPICNSCTVIFNGSVAGPKELKPQGVGGLILNESPLIQIEYNERTYGLSKTFLWQNGIHRDFKIDTNYDLELNLYFRDIYYPEKMLAVAIPLTIDDANGKPYFSEMNTGVSTIPMDTIINNGQILVYKGIDLQGRDGEKKQKAPQCSDISSNLTWLIFSPSFIKSADAAKIRSIQLPNTNTVPLPDHEITLARARQMCMLIPTVRIKTAVDAMLVKKAEAAKNKDVFLTRALQCQRIDPSKDVRGDSVYLNSKQGGNTLEKELDDAANLNKSIDEKKNGSYRAKQIEDLIAIIVGVILGLVLISLVAYYIFTHLYKGYLPVQEKAAALISSATPPCKPPLLI